MIQAGRMMAVCLGVCLMHTPSARAQERGRLEIALGGSWTGPTGFGGADATETAPSGSRFTLFATETELAAAGGLDARVALGVARSLQVEGAASYRRLQLRTEISGDVEGAPGFAVEESIRQFAFDGGLVLQLARWRFGPGATPFVAAGGGYLRELHEGRTLAAGGQTAHVGAGVKYLIVSREGRWKGVGVRGDVRAVLRVNGAALDSRAHVAPVVAVSGYVRF